MANRLRRSALLLGFAVLAGCGGSGSQNGGGFAIAIQWPASRTIPELTQSLVIRVIGPGISLRQAIDRPANATTSSVQFSGLPIGQELVVQCNAYGAPSDGNAPLLGIAETPVTLESATGTSITLTVQSTIEQLVFTGSALTGNNLTLYPGQSTNLTVTAYSTTTSVVPIGPGNLTFTSSGTGFTITPNGTSVAVLAGAGATSGTITATEKESGVTSTITVSIP